jgi:hypothetical protein
MVDSNDDFVARLEAVAPFLVEETAEKFWFPTFRSFAFEVVDCICTPAKLLEFLKVEIIQKPVFSFAQTHRLIRSSVNRIGEGWDKLIKDFKACVTCPKCQVCYVQPLLVVIPAYRFLLFDLPVLFNTALNSKTVTDKDTVFDVFLPTINNHPLVQGRLVSGEWEEYEKYSRATAPVGCPLVKASNADHPQNAETLAVDPTRVPSSDDLPEINEELACLILRVQLELILRLSPDQNHRLSPTQSTLVIARQKRYFSRFYDDVGAVIRHLLECAYPYSTEEYQKNLDLYLNHGFDPSRKLCRFPITYKDVLELQLLTGCSQIPVMVNTARRKALEVLAAALVSQVIYYSLQKAHPEFFFKAKHNFNPYTYLRTCWKRLEAETVDWRLTRGRSFRRKIEELLTDINTQLGQNTTKATYRLDENMEDLALNRTLHMILEDAVEDFSQSPEAASVLDKLR